MNEREPKITADEARSTLESLEGARSTAAKTLRPPMWLNAISSLLFGAVTIAASLQSGSAVWTSIMFFLAVAFVSTYGYWLRQCRKMGTTARIFPSGLASQLFYAAQAVFFGATIFGSQALYENGTVWAPYVAALVNSAVLSFLLHSYPTTEWGTRAVSK